LEIYSYSEARQKLFSVLDKAESTGKVLIRRRDGRTYALVPEHVPTSPLDVPSVKANMSTEEVVSLIRSARGKTRGKNLSRIQRRQDAVSIRVELHEKRRQEEEIGH